MANKIKDTEAWVNSQSHTDEADWQESGSPDWQDSDSADTDLIPDLDEYYANRVGKLFSNPSVRTMY